MRVSRSTGGWGFAAGDDGSGARLGQDLLRLVLHCNDGLAPHSDLTRAVLLEFGDTAAQLATFAQQASPGDFGQYALKVVSAAEAGDTQALTLRQNTVQAIQTGLDAVGFTRH